MAILLNVFTFIKQAEIYMYVVEKLEMLMLYMRYTGDVTLEKN